VKKTRKNLTKNLRTPKRRAGRDGEERGEKTCRPGGKGGEGKREAPRPSGETKPSERKEEHSRKKLKFASQQKGGDCRGERAFFDSSATEKAERGRKGDMPGKETSGWLARKTRRPPAGEKKTGGRKRGIEKKRGGWSPRPGEGCPPSP